MNRKQAYLMLVNNGNNNTIVYKANSGDVTVNQVTVENRNPDYEYQSLTSAFLFYSKANSSYDIIEKVAWKNIKKINGVVFKDGKR